MDSSVTRALFLRRCKDQTSPSRSTFQRACETFQASAPEAAFEFSIAARSWARSIQMGTENAYHRRNSTKKGEIMQKILLSIAVLVVASFASGQTTRQPLMNMNERQPTQQMQRPTTTSQTTSTTDASGTITEYTPGSAIVLRESSGPVRYRFGKTVTYVTRSGRVLDENTVRTRIKVGVPVRVHYVGTGTNMMVDRVILDED
jgi:hypothetical protein